MQSKRPSSIDNADHHHAGGHDRALGELLREVAATEQLIAQIMQDRARAEARGEHDHDLTAAKWEADILADLRELADMGRRLARDMRRPLDGAARSKILRAQAAQTVDRHHKMAQTERDTAQMLEYRLTLESRIREGRHPETMERDLYRYAVLGELVEMAMDFARTGKRPDPAAAEARFAEAERAARLRFLTGASSTRH
jgi:hypothetical protein